MTSKLPPNPFVGLRPFEAEESLLFFGRHEQTLELLQRLHESRFVAVVGSSGSGKSSLVRAGLIPKLQAGFLVEDRDTWHVARMQPRDQPFQNLVDSLLGVAGGGPEKASEEMLDEVRETGGQCIVDRLRPTLGATGNLLLLVDQFEEVFRFISTRSLPHHQSVIEEAADFVSVMLGMAQQRELPVYVIMTIRSDFLGDCDTFLGLPEAMNKSQYLVPRLTRQQRREAIEGPVRLYDGQVRARLTDRLLNETVDVRDDLPVLQHALMRTWEFWKRNGRDALDVKHYEAVGTIREALSRDAEAALDGLGEDQVFLAKRLFQTLTTTDSAHRYIRRPARLSVVVERTGAAAEDLWEIVTRFRSGGRSFLVVSTEKLEEDPLLDISHESLIRQWGRLKGWVEEELESARVYRRLAETAELHAAGRAGLYRDPDLQLALDWKERETPTASWAHAYHDGYEGALRFLDESREARDRERRRRLMTWLAIVLTLVAIVVVVSVLAWIAQRERDIERAGRLAYRAESTRAEQPYRQTERVLVAAVAVQRLRELAPERDSLLAAEETLRRDAARLPELRFPLVSEDGLILAAHSPEGRYLAGATAGGEVLVWEVEGGGMPAVLRWEALVEEITGLEFDPSGRHLTAEVDWQGVVSWSRNGGWEGAAARMLLEGEADWEISYGEDGLWAAAAGEDLVRVWKLPPQGGEPALLASWPVSRSPRVLLLSPDRRRLAASVGGSVQLWDLATPSRRQQLSEDAQRMAFSLDGRWLAVARSDAVIDVWDLATGRRVEAMRMQHRDRVLDLDFDGRGQLLASGSLDGTFRIWDFVQGVERIRKELGAQKEAYEASVDAGLARVETRQVNSVRFSPDSRYLATAGDDRTARVWDVASGREIAQTSFDDNVARATFGPDGRTLAVEMSAGPRGWMLEIGGLEPLTHRFPSEGGVNKPVRYLRFDSRGGRLLSATPDAEAGDWKVWLWSLQDSALESRWEGTSLQEALAANTAAEIAGEASNGDPLSSVSPGDRYRASLGEDGKIKVEETGEGTSVLQHPFLASEIGALAVGPEGKYVATAEVPGEGAEVTTITVWEVRTGDRVGRIAHPAFGVSALAFAPTAEPRLYLASGGEDGTVRLWPARLEDLISHVCSRLPRKQLTPGECAVYFPDEPCPDPCGGGGAAP